ncbi:MAG: DUF3336 domain-containing protein [Gammaproteobacteria bacterium]|nr:DUF3336 domain-containing protein [Gammaproteobacteria bacterium]
MNAPTASPAATTARPSRIPPDLSSADSYESWKAAALAADEASGAAQWRQIESSRSYDYRIIRKRLDEVRAHKRSGDAHALLFCLNEGIHGNMGGMGRPALYNRTKFGTKDLITSYISELAEAINSIAAVPESVIPFAESSSSSDGPVTASAVRH